ncbi:hypothetical protein AYI69_g640, partial [Smittium culicis]
MENKKWDSE